MEKNKFIIEISREEFIQLIKEYYLNSDNSVTDVNVVYSSRWVRGTWNEVWEYYSGGYRSMTANVEIIQKINALGESRTVKRHECIGNNYFIHILSVLLEKDNLKATFVDEESGDKIKIWCEKVVNEDKKNVSASMKENLLKLKKTYF